MEDFDLLLHVKLSICELLINPNCPNWFQVTVFDVPTHWSDLGGSCLVLMAVLSMGLEDWVMARWDWRCL